MEYKLYNNKVKIHTVKSKKFKNCILEIMFTNKIDKSKKTINTLLDDLLFYSSEKYKTRRELSIELENLYNASVRCWNTRIGENLVTHMNLDFLNPKYCEEGYLEDVIKLPFELLFKPNIVDGKFEEKSYTIVENRLKAYLESEKDYATGYALDRSLECMDENSLSSIRPCGKLEDLLKIKNEDVVKEYKELLKSSCEIYVLGDIDMDEVVQLIEKHFDLNNEEYKGNYYVDNKVKDQVLEVEESGRYEQSTLIMINNMIDVTERERNITYKLFNYIFGSGGLTSKLYKYIREENSLCYALSSSYYRNDNLLIIYAGINSKYKNKCMELVQKALTEMIDGDFSDEELVDAKKNIETMIKSSLDSLYGIIGTYYSHITQNTPLVEDQIKEINSVTKEEIRELAKKVKLNTVFLLVGEDEK